MKPESSRTPWAITGLVAAAFLGIAVILGFSYRATRQWQRTSNLLIALDTNEVADLIVRAVTRDMAAVQARVLASRDWTESLSSNVDMASQVAIAFTRYPYPESFFSWTTSDITFFNRFDRYPGWMSRHSASHDFPVVLITKPAEAEVLRDRTDSYGAMGFRYVVFDTVLGGQPYQVVARLTYADPLQEKPEWVVGFTVNLGWVRQFYFQDILSQVLPLVQQRSRSEIAILDENQKLVWGTTHGSPGTIREFPLLFINPAIGKVALEAASQARKWQIHVTQERNSPLVTASHDADQARAVIGVAALVLCLSVVFGIRAVRAEVNLAMLKSDFVSSVTHDLKMPLANIRMMADTMALRPVSQEKLPKYARFLKHESRRLTRLIDNLLAYARITDVANVYSFEPIAVAPLVSDVLQNFQSPLTEGFSMIVDIPDELPPVRADRGAMILALENLVDNAIRYSNERPSIRIVARQVETAILLEVHDRGFGIPPAELNAIRRKFVRGRRSQLGGKGLGLTIVSRILVDHGGEFTLESACGLGTVARLSVPVAKEPNGV